MKDCIEAGLLVGGFIGFMVFGLMAIMMVPGAQAALALSFLSMFGACFSAEM